MPALAIAGKATGGESGCPDFMGKDYPRAWANDIWGLACVSARHLTHRRRVVGQMPRAAAALASAPRPAVIRAACATTMSPRTGRIARFASANGWQVRASTFTL